MARQSWPRTASIVTRSDGAQKGSRHLRRLSAAPAARSRRGEDRGYRGRSEQGIGLAAKGSQGMCHPIPARGARARRLRWSWVWVTCLLGGLNSHRVGLVSRNLWYREMSLRARTIRS